MPANLIHCQVCRALLNEDLDKSSVEIPEFVPLQELDSMIEVEPGGVYVECPHCTRELRINRKYVHKQVSCKFCKGMFLLDLTNRVINCVAFYTECPHCSEEIRAAKKYMGMKVACKMCGGKIHLVR